MNDRPSPDELLAAVRQCLEHELLPAITDQRLRFQTLVAANVLAILEREWRTEESHLLWEWEWLAEALECPGPAPARLTALRQAVHEANAQLCERIRNGDFDGDSRFLALGKQLRRTVERKLEVANPRYLASVTAETFPPAKESP